jgi:hypothetical protein
MALSVCLVTLGLRAETTPMPVTSEPAIPRFAIGAEAGTAGFGPFAVITANKRFTFDVGYTWLSYGYDFSDNEGDYNGDLKFSNVQVIANWHPMAGSFHLSAGVFLSDNKVTLTAKAKPGVGYGIGDHNYSGNQITSVDGTVELTKGAAPYLGVGWSKNPANSGFGFYCKLGVLFMDSPSTKLVAYGPAAGSAQVQADLRKDEASANDDLNSLRYYPVIEMGVMYRF